MAHHRHHGERGDTEQTESFIPIESIRDIPEMHFNLYYSIELCRVEREKLFNIKTDSTN